MAARKELIPVGERKKRKREIAAVVLLSILLLIFTYRQFSFTQLSPVHSIFFIGLVNLNILLILFLFLLVFRNLVKSFVEREGKLLGSSLRSKLIAAFTTLSLVPTLLMFVVSVVYINSSFDRWFSENMKGILKDSLEITNSYYVTAKKKNYHFAHQIVEDLRQRPQGLQRRLKYFVEHFGVDAIEYYPGLLEDRLLEINKDIVLQSLPELSLELLDKGIRQGQEASLVHQFGEGNLVRVIVPVPGKGAAIVVSSFIPLYLMKKISDIATAHNSFKDLDYLEFPLRSIYLIILTLMSLVIMLCATWFGFTLAKGLSVPLVKLSAASQSVAQGIYEPVKVLSGSREINVLVESFNHMMRDLESSEKEVQQANQNLRETLSVLDKHTQYIEVILSNVSTGVISVNREGEVTTLNREAEKLLKIDPQDLRLRKLQDLLGPNYKKIVQDLLADARRYRAPSIKKDLQVEIHGEELNLQVTITFLRGEGDEDLGFVLVLDDLTVLANAQRTAAWREVAKRIAHEIKNPLTPIKLAAQRLQRKFGAEIADPAFKDCIDTIVSQTDGLKHLVNEFSNFARLPQVKLREDKIERVLREVVVLYEAGHKHIEFDYQVGEDIPVLLFDAEQMKRVFVNLIDNAVAAMENTREPKLRVAAKFDKSLDLVRVDIEDNGPGIAAKNVQQVFEPYYSTKSTGTGLGLAIVKKIIEDHNAYIRVYRLSPQGTKFVVELPVTHGQA